MAQSSPATSVKVKKARVMYDWISSPKLPPSATGPGRLPVEACQVRFPPNWRYTPFFHGLHHLEFGQNRRNQVFHSKVPLGASKMPAITRHLVAKGSKTWFLTASLGFVQSPTSWPADSGGRALEERTVAEDSTLSGVYLYTPYFLTVSTIALRLSHFTSSKNAPLAMI